MTGETENSSLPDLSHLRYGEIYLLRGVAQSALLEAGLEIDGINYLEEVYSDDNNPVKLTARNRVAEALAHLNELYGIMTTDD